MSVSICIPFKTHVRYMQAAGVQYRYMKQFALEKVFDFSVAAEVNSRGFMLTCQVRIGANLHVVLLGTSTFRLFDWKEFSVLQRCLHYVPGELDMPCVIQLFTLTFTTKSGVIDSFQSYLIAHI